MLNKKYIYTLLSLLLVMGFSCKKSDIPVYEQYAGVSFSTLEYNYSFIEDIDLAQKTVYIPVAISGSAVDYDREFEVRIPAEDTLTTASSDQYSLTKGLVKANEYTGRVGVTLNYDNRLNDSIYTCVLEIVPSDNFPQYKLNQYNVKVNFTKKVIKPANWNGSLRWSFGDYSTSWWTFIMKITGRTSLPFWNVNNPDPEVWWMTSAELKSYKDLVKFELKKFNDTPEGPLKHDDGPSKGKDVVMP